MLVNQRTHNLYFFITVTFTLTHLKRTKAPAAKPPQKVQKMKFGWINRLWNKWKPRLKSEIIYVSPAMLTIFAYFDFLWTHTE